MRVSLRQVAFRTKKTHVYSTDIPILGLGTEGENANMPIFRVLFIIADE